MLNVQKHVVLASFTTFGIGGPADYFVGATSKEELIEAVAWAKEKNLPFFVLGKGANILVGDKGFRGLVIKNEANKFEISNDFHNPLSITHNQKDSVLFTADSGADVQEIIAYTGKIGLSGFEHFAGIPSSIGGALWQNLHFLSPDRTRTVYISEILQGAEILTNSQKVGPSRKDRPCQKTVAKDYFNFSYDYSSLHESQDIVLSATFSLTPKSPLEIQKTINDNLTWRQEKHPANATTCSAGSVFKKIEGYGAGRLIEKVGLKGYVIGGAQISPKHANFIVNTGGATAQDVMELIQLVQKKIKDELGLEMQPEISLVGEF